MKNLVLIGGPMGVGKSTVAKMLLHALPGCVWLDGDWCWNASPFNVNERTKEVVVDNICHCLNNFISCGEYENIILSWVMHEQSIIDCILSRLNLDGVSVTCITLTCSEEQLVKRLEKDIAEGLRAPDVIDRAVERLKAAQLVSAIKMDTTDKTALQVADGILNILS